MRVVVVGSGFAGAIAARIANTQQHQVTLLDRGRHPRFALGESSTPLAAISLERLAGRYGLADLRHLASYGRWRDHLPELRCGLKRGFTFYRHRRGRPFLSDAANTSRLLVAASPDDAAADAHWVREDVDDFLVRRAQDEGVCYLDATDLAAVDRDGDAYVLRATRRGRPLRLTADFVVDASGAAGVVARCLGIDSERQKPGLHTALVYGHFEGVKPLVSTLPREAIVPPGPFSDERAAVHHLIDEGWMYELRFDTDVVSAGIVLDLGPDGATDGQCPTPRAARTPSETFHDVLRAYPTLARQFERAKPVRPIAAIPSLQRRLARATGHRWAALPHTYMFWSPLFSTGIAWSLVGVERLGLMLERGVSSGRRTMLLQRYDATLTCEGRHLQRLIEGAYSCRHDFGTFDAYAQVYFAAASYCETVQRLCAPRDAADGEWAWCGFLGATEPVLKEIVTAAAQLIRAASPPARLETARHLIAPRNLAGLADPIRRRLYPVDLAAVVGAAELLGLSRDEVRSRLPRLRSSDPENARPLSRPS